MGTAPGGAGGGAGKVVLVIAVVVGALLVVSILAAIAIPVFLNQSAKAEAAVVAAMTCDDVVAGTLAPGAVNLVDTGLPAPDAIGDVTLDSDYRPVPELPPPGQYSLVLVCSGTGVWADGSERALMAAGRVDSGGRVSFEWAAMP